jgi:NAD(P) transhydrogenase subunit beta
VSASAISTAAYIVGSLLFILCLAGLSRHETARQGWTFGLVGMVVAIAATIGLSLSGSKDVGTAVVILVVAMIIGGAIGLWRARVVQMTGMPELIALLHSFVGLAAVLVGWASYT